MTRVVLPTHLRSYAAGAGELEASGVTLREILADLESRHPGLWVRIIDEQDRIRPHIKCFIGADQASHLDVPVGSSEVYILAALSGGC